MQHCVLHTSVLTYYRTFSKSTSSLNKQFKMRMMMTYRMSMKDLFVLLIPLCYFLQVFSLLHPSCPAQEKMLKMYRLSMIFQIFQISRLFLSSKYPLSDGIRDTSSFLYVDLQYPVLVGSILHQSVIAFSQNSTKV